MRKILVLAVLGVVCAAVPVFAQEELGPATGGVANLEAGFPASILDTTATPAGAWEVGLAGSYVTDPATYETALLQVNYGLLSNVQLSAAWAATIGEGKVVGNGDTTLAVLWAAVAEQDNLPSMGIQVSGRLPSGDGFTGYDGGIAGVATKTLGEARVHLNAGYTTIGDDTAGVRNDADFFALGMDYPLLDNLVMVIDGVSAESHTEGADRLESVEVGVRAALSDVDTLSVGVGAGIGNGNTTPAFSATVGYQRAL